MSLIIKYQTHQGISMEYFYFSKNCYYGAMLRQSLKIKNQVSFKLSPYTI